MNYNNTNIGRRNTEAQSDRFDELHMDDHMNDLEVDDLLEEIQPGTPNISLLPIERGRELSDEEIDELNEWLLSVNDEEEELSGIAEEIRLARVDVDLDEQSA